MASDEAGNQDDGAGQPAGAAWSAAAGRVGPAAPPPWAALADARERAAAAQPTEEAEPVRPAPAPPLQAPGGTYGSRSYGTGTDAYSADDLARPSGSPWRYPRRYRRRGGGAVGILVFLVVAIIVAATHHSSSSSSSFPTIDPANEPPAEHLTLTLGQPANLQAVISYTNGFQPTYAPVTITPTAVTQPATLAAASDVNTTVKLTVCAGTQGFTPGVIFSDTLSVITAQEAVVDIQLGDDSTSAALDDPLQPGQCETGTQGFDVPGGSKVTQINFGAAISTQQATWAVAG